MALRTAGSAIESFGWETPEGWNELGDLLEFSSELMIQLQSVLPGPRMPNARYAPAAAPSPAAIERGSRNGYVQSRASFGNRVHYDRVTDPTRYSHEGGPAQVVKFYNRGTEFEFARRGQGGFDVTYRSGPHPSTYPNSNWPAGANKADFNPDTPSGRARPLPSGVYKILYDPDTGKLQF